MSDVEEALRDEREHLAHTVEGFDFDAVVVVDPQAILAQPLSGGAGALYTALTRSTRALAIVHADGLPPGLASSPLLTHLGPREPDGEWARLERDRAAG